MAPIAWTRKRFGRLAVATSVFCALAGLLVLVGSLLFFNAQVLPVARLLDPVLVLDYVGLFSGALGLVLLWTEEGAQYLLGFLGIGLNILLFLLVGGLATMAAF